MMLSDYELAVLTLFCAVPRANDGKGKIDNTENVKHGVYVTESAVAACPSLTEEESMEQIWDMYGYDMLDMNRGFYKNFHEVQEASEDKWLIHQLLHYLSVGLQNEDMTDPVQVDSSIVFVPTTKLQLPEGAPIKLTVIDVIERDDIIKRTQSMINSGMALSQESLRCIVHIIKEMGIEVDIQSIPNKELKIYLYDMMQQVPQRAQEFLRLLIFKATNSTLLIKSQDVIERIRNVIKEGKTGLLYTDMFRAFVSQNGMGALAAEFLRYKKLWLAFKGESSELAHILNRARKMAEKHKYVKKTGLLERITWDTMIEPAEVAKEIPKVTIYRRISLANNLLYWEHHPTSAMYLIRNGKTYAKAVTEKRVLTDKQKQILELLLESIVSEIRPRVQGRKYYIPPEVEYALPVSEKRFVGGIPFYSSLKLSKSAVMGIHWENLPRHRVDLDLHYVSQKYRVGWNTQFDRKAEIVFSGDMTDAPPEEGGATEAFFLSDKLVDDWAAVMLNCFTSNDDPVPYKFVMGPADSEQLSKDYLLNCHKLAVNINIVNERDQDFLGFMHTDKTGEKTFYFMEVGFGHSIVASYGKKERIALEAVQATVESSLKLREVLKRAGAILVESANEAEVDLGLDKVTREKFVNLLA
ncbi:hypothetical protein [Selenomonas sp. AB3002]|uniref:hypothetical protein n=1 Tax=Selenomonas sp. AB3002 TaxID=1392502 RepID=UPI000497E8F8